jgi:hypothetical protein
MFIVVAEAVGPQGEPEPDVYASGGEGDGFALSSAVWDVAPSPDWRYIAEGAAYVVTPDSGDVIGPARWEALGTTVREPASLVRDVSFSIGTRSRRYGFALPLIEDRTKPCRGNDPTACPNGAPATAGGWRVRWLRDGSMAAFGIGPQRPTDDAPATVWTLVDPTDGQGRGTTADTTMFAPAVWTFGPTLDASVLDSLDGPPLRAGNLVVESRGGWVRVVDDSTLGARSRIVGPGRALVATNQARYIAALVPRPDARPGEPPVRLVVYYTNR